MPLIPQRSASLDEEHATSSPPGKEGLAVNLFDLDRLLPMVRQALFHKGVLDLSGTVRVDVNRPDEVAVIFSCPLVQAASICDVVRSRDRMAGDHPTRVYLKRAVAWIRLPGDAVLTGVRQTENGEELLLNPSIFALSVPKAKPPAAKVVQLGMRKDG